MLPAAALSEILNLSIQSEIPASAQPWAGCLGRSWFRHCHCPSGLSQWLCLLALDITDEGILLFSPNSAGTTGAGFFPQRLLNITCLPSIGCIHVPDIGCTTGSKDRLPVCFGDVIWVSTISFHGRKRDKFSHSSDLNTDLTGVMISWVGSSQSASWSAYVSLMKCRSIWDGATYILPLSP